MRAGSSMIIIMLVPLKGVEDTIDLKGVGYYRFNNNHS